MAKREYINQVDYTDDYAAQELQQQLGNSSTLTSPYMRNFMEALNHSQLEYESLQEEIAMADAQNLEKTLGQNYITTPYIYNLVQATNREFPPAAPVEEVDLTGSYRRRRGFLALIAVFMLLIMAVLVMGYLKVDFTNQYVTVFEKTNGTYIDLTDPIFGFVIKHLDLGLDVDSIFYQDCLQYIESETNTAVIIALYALPFLALAFILLTVLVFFMSLAAIFKSSLIEGYVLKKVRIGFLLFLLFIIGAAIATCGILWNSIAIDELVPFFTQEASFLFAGYGLFAMIGLSLLGWLASLFSYKNIKEEAYYGEEE